MKNQQYNMIILQKQIARLSDYSRRKAEELIRLGKVRVNGSVAFLGQTVDPDNDMIQVKGKTITGLRELIYIKFNKPRGYVSTTAKFSKEKNIFDLVNINERLFPIGRLDKSSRGLMILTNDGDLTQRLSHPRYGQEKTYEVKAIGGKEKRISDSFAGRIISSCLKGVNIGEGDGKVKAKKASYLGLNIFSLVLGEGKKRQIRRMFEALGLKVVDLKRVEISGLKLGNLKEGSWERLSIKELDMLQKM